MDGIALRQKMVGAGILHKDLANELGISKSALNRKLSGRSEFDRREIKMIISLLNLSPNEVMSIFFTT